MFLCRVQGFQLSGMWVYALSIPRLPHAAAAVVAAAVFLSYFPLSFTSIFSNGSVYIYFMNRRSLWSLPNADIVIVFFEKKKKSNLHF